jgi:hypothetical protein
MIFLAFVVGCAGGLDGSVGATQQGGRDVPDLRWE